MHIFKHLSRTVTLICLLASCTSYDETFSVADKTPVATLRATLFSGSATKASFGDVTTSDTYAQVIWNANDQLNVFSSTGSFLYETKQGGETAIFDLVSESAPQGTSFLGLSPYSETATANVTSKTISTEIPRYQIAYAETFDPSALITVGASPTADQMSFYNVCTGFRFTLSGSQIASYHTIEFKGNNGEKIAGPVSISQVGQTEPSSTALSGSATSVSLSLPENGSFEKDVHYYILFRPCVFRYGFSLVFKDASGTELFTRKCNSFVEFKRSVFPSVRDADDENRLPAIKDGTLLSGDGTANCYIVSSAGYYKFPVVRGNEEDALSGVDAVRVLWETDNTSSSQVPGSIISSVTTNGKYVYFQTPDPLKDGNAVIAAYSGEDIVWSWHVWVCSGYNPTSTSQAYPGKDLAMMDRNLGALSFERGNALSNGLFYQWGRKDPFPGAVESFVSSSSGGTFMGTTLNSDLSTVASDASTGTVEYAIANPTTFITPTQNNIDWIYVPDHTLWSSAAKTLYDPCPSGWRLPEAYLLDSNKQRMTSQEAWSEVNFASGYGYGIYLPLGGSYAWYPNNGYISREGKLLMVGQYSCYWSCSRNGLFEFTLELSQVPGSALSYNPVCHGKARGEGHSVRCIEDK